MLAARWPKHMHAALTISAARVRDVNNAVGSCDDVGRALYSSPDNTDRLMAAFRVNRHAIVEA